MDPNLAPDDLHGLAPGQLERFQPPVTALPLSRGTHGLRALRLTLQGVTLRVALLGSSGGSLSTGDPRSLCVVFYVRHVGVRAW